MFTTHDWEWFESHRQKNGDGWGMVQICANGIALPTLKSYNYNYN